MSNSVSDLLRLGTELLSPSLSPKLDSELLLSKVLEVSKEKLLTLLNDQVSLIKKDAYIKLINKRKANYPVAYLINKKEFWGLEFLVNEAVLIPRPETETLIDKALEYLTSTDNINILDLGTGSACIACALAYELKKHNKNFKIIATDCSSKALEVARQNIIALNLESHTSLIESNWFDNLNLQKFDLIISNPPYIANNDQSVSPEIHFEPKQALFSDDNGKHDLKKIISLAYQYLKPEGKLLCEIGATQASELKKYAENFSYANCEVYKDLAKKDRVMVFVGRSASF